MIDFYFKKDMTPYEKHNAYLEQLKKDFVKICKIEFLHPDYSINFVLDNNYMNKNSGNFIQESGQLSVNRNNGMRRTASGITLYNPNGEFDYSVNKIWHRQLVRLSMGILLPNEEEYYIPQMVGYIKQPSMREENGYKTMTFPLVDKWGMVDGSLGGNLDGIYQIPLNTNLFTAIDTIRKFDYTTVTETTDKIKMIDPINPIYTNYYNGKMVTLPNGTSVPLLNTPYTARIESGSYADVWLEMNKMLAGWIGYDQTGRLKIDPSQDDIKDGDKPLDWVFNPWVENDFVSQEISYDNEKIYNDIIVEGGVTGGKMAKGRATNNNIKSDVNVNIIGLKTAPRSEYRNDKLLTDEQCQDYANWALKQNIAMAKSISISSAQKFHLQENNLCGIITEKDSTTIDKHLILGFNIPLAQTGFMSINAISINKLQ